MLTCCCFPHYCYGDGDDDADAGAVADADADDGGGLKDAGDGGGDDLQQPKELESHPLVQRGPPAPAARPTAADRTSWETVAAKGQVMKCWCPL